MVGKDKNPPLSQVMRFSSETLAPRDRIAHWREVFGRQVFRIDIEAVPDSQFIGDVTLHALPGLKIMCGIVRDVPGRILSLNIPRAAIAPLVPGVDDALMHPIPRDCAALRLLTSYV